METVQRLHAQGIEITIPTIKNYAATVREQSQKWISKLAKSRRAEYIAQYRERIQEVEAVQRKLWSLMRPDTSPRTQVEACGKLLDCTSQLIELYDSLPVISAIRDYDALQEPGPSDQASQGSGTVGENTS
jgi:hypothetical protein